MQPEDSVPRPSGRQGTAYITAAIVALFGTIASTGLWYWLCASEQKTLESDFALLAAERAGAIQRELNQDVEVINSISSLYAASTEVSRDEFHAFTSRAFRENRSVMSLEWVPKIALSDRREFESRLGEELQRTITISQVGTSRRLETAGIRDTYYPVEYLMQPKESPSGAYAFDHASDPMRWEAMQRALESGQPVASQKLTLFRLGGTDEQRAGILIAMPVFDAAGDRNETAATDEQLQGFVMGLFRLADVVRRAQADLIPAGIDFVIMDDGAEDRLLHMHASRSRAAGRTVTPAQVIEGNRGVSETIEVDAAGRKWRLVFSPTDKFLAARRSWAPHALMVSALLATVTLSGCVFLIWDRTTKVQQLVHTRTEELEQANRQLQTEVAVRKEAEAFSEQQALKSKLLHQATRTAATADSISTALQRCVRLICRLADIPVGHVYMCRTVGTPTMVSTDFWSTERHTFQPLRQALTQAEVVKGTGLVGQIWETGEPGWIPDLEHSDSSLLRESCMEAGIQSTCGFPVKVHGETMAVLEFFARDASVIDRSLIQSFQALGDQIGRALEKKEAQIALRDSESRMRAILETAVDAIITINSRGIVLSMNPASEQMFGYSSSELIGKNVSTLMPSPDRENHDSYLARYLSSGQRSVIGIGREAEGRRKDGSTFAMELAVSELEAGQQRLFTGIVRDVTEKKRAAAELAAQAEELARANEILADKNRELDEFTYVASHDLQEPIRKLVSFSELLKQDLGDQLNEQADRDIHFIVDAAQRMRTLVQDLLSLSRAGRSAMKMAPTSIDACVDRALDALELRINETQAQIVRDPLPTVTADPTLITQLYQNLIENALKFTKAEPPVVHLTAEQDQEMWTLGVKDNGIGLKSEHAERIFQPFQRLHGRNDYAGTGIGLAICKKTVQRHGGEIRVESQPGAGAHFRFTIPSSDPQEPTCPSDQRQIELSSC